MIIHSEIENELCTVKEYYLDKTSSLNESCNLTSNCAIQHQKSIHYDSLPEEQKRLSYFLEIKSSNASSTREVIFRFNDSINAEKLAVNSITLSVRNVELNEFFQIADYSRFKDLNFDALSFFPQESIDESILKAKKYIDQCAAIFNSSDFRKIISGNNWEKIPIDMSPYK